MLTVTLAIVRRLAASGWARRHVVRRCLAVGRQGLDDAELTIEGTLSLDRTSSLIVDVDDAHTAERRGLVVVISARRVRGRFGSVTALGFHSDVEYTDCGVFVRLRRDS